MDFLKEGAQQLNIENGLNPDGSAKEQATPPAEPPVDPPPAEPPVNNEGAEPQSPPAEPPKNDPPPAEPPSFHSLLNEKLGTEFETEDQFMEKWGELQKPKEAEYPFDFVKELISYMSQSDIQNDEHGRHVMGEWVTLQNTNFDKLAAEDPMQVMIMDMQKQYPTLTREEIMDDLDEKFPIHKDLYNEDEKSPEQIETEIARAQRRLKIASTDAARRMKELQTDLKIPDAEKQRQATQATQKENQQKQIAAYQNAAKNFFEEFKEVKVGEYSHVVNVRENGKWTNEFEGSAKMMDNPQEFMNQFVNPKTGFWDPAKIGRVQFILDNLEAIVGSASKKAQSETTEEIVNEMRNTQSNSQQAHPQNAGTDMSATNAFFGH